MLLINQNLENFDPFGLNVHIAILDPVYTTDTNVVFKPTHDTPLTQLHGCVLTTGFSHDTNVSTLFMHRNLTSYLHLHHCTVEKIWAALSQPHWRTGSEGHAQRVAPESHRAIHFRVSFRREDWEEERLAKPVA